MGLSIYYRVLATRLGRRGVLPSQRGGFVQVFTGACKHPRPWRWCPMQVLDNTWKVAPRGPLRTGVDAPRGASTRKYPEGPGGESASGANQRQAGGKHSKIDGYPDRLSRQVRRRRQTPRTATRASAPTTRASAPDAPLPPAECVLHVVENVRVGVACHVVPAVGKQGK